MSSVYDDGNIQSDREHKVKYFFYCFDSYKEILNSALSSFKNNSGANYQCQVISDIPSVLGRRVSALAHILERGIFVTYTVLFASDEF